MIPVNALSNTQTLRQSVEQGIHLHASGFAEFAFQFYAGDGGDAFHVKRVFLLEVGFPKRNFPTAAGTGAGLINRLDTALAGWNVTPFSGPLAPGSVVHNLKIRLPKTGVCRPPGAWYCIPAVEFAHLNEPASGNVRCPGAFMPPQTHE